MDKLEPCPFCGSEDIAQDIYVRDGRMVACNHCHASITRFNPDGNGAAILAWNTRPPSQAVGGWRLAELMRAADAPEPERPGRFDLSMNDAVIRWEAWASAKAKFTEACVAYVRAMISAAPPPPEGQS